MLARRRRHQHAVIVIAALAVLLIATAASNASSSGMKVMVMGTCSDQVGPLATAIRAEPGVAKVTTFDSSAGTPTPAMLASRNLVVATGDNCGPQGSSGGYAHAVTWGNRVATYLDGGGALLQTAYDVWDSDNTYPRGRFQSGGYEAFVPGPNPNSPTTLGTVLRPSNPIVKGLGTFPSTDNTTDALAPGATLLAKWADDRNAIAVKGHVVSTTAGAYDADTLPDLARLAVNTGKYFGLPDTKITKATINRAKNTARFAFKAIPSEPKFECVLFLTGARGRHTFGACKSGNTYKNLVPGKYTFEVRAVGSIKPDPTPAAKTFRIR